MNGLNPVELFIPEMKQLIQNKNLDELKNLLKEMNPIDLADGFKHFTQEHQLLILKLLKPERVIEVFEELEVTQQEYLILHLEDLTLSPLLEGVPSDVTAKLFKKLPEKTVKKMERLMKKERVEVIQSRLEFPASSVGSLMQTGVISVGPDLTAKSALELLQSRTRMYKEMPIETLYVTNENNKLLGGLTLRTLIAAPPDIKVKDIMAPVSLIRILAKSDQEEAAKTFSRYKLISAPVVDDDNRLIGVLMADDMIQVIQQEDTEDIQRLAGVEALEQPYFKTAFLQMIQKRATWLCILFVGEMLTATAMGFFEKEIAKAVVLALFIPLIISSGGNSGSQASTLIVRALALKEVGMKDWWRVMWREVSSGLILGLILGTLGFLRITIGSHFSDAYGPYPLPIAITVGFSLTLVVLWGTVTGSLFPIFLRRLGLDPAVASAPLVATLVDVTGLLIYFTIALFALQGTLL
ncbi:MAG: magnesium transporter [Elusimicrobia bacterium]|nr:magnesium transporter [Elusimicrobiota bacterium]MBI4218345.1 magnesium transporter [Elusimicrobiota bacterium]